jgi:acetyl esterase/lipase
LSTIQHPAPIETHHPLSAEDRESETELIAAIERGRDYFARAPHEAYDALTALTPIVAGLELEAVDLGDVCGWWIRPPAAPPDRAILFVHGGAYRLGSARAYRGFASQIAARAGVAAFVLEYPLAPARPFPAAYDAVIAALPWLRARGFAYASLVGDSAGGGLVLAASNAHAPASPAIRSVVAFSPWTDLACSGESFSDPNVIDPIFDPVVLREAASVYLAGAEHRGTRVAIFVPLPSTTERLRSPTATRFAVGAECVASTVVSAKAGALETTAIVAAMRGRKTFFMLVLSRQC